MPGQSFYDGLPLAAQLAKFNAHHHDPLTRHISGFESEMLDKVGNVLSATASKSVPSVKGGGRRIVFVTGGLVTLAGLGVIGRNLYLARRREADRDGHQSATDEPPRSDPPAVECP
jgi:hypothetical protein